MVLGPEELLDRSFSPSWRKTGRGQENTRTSSHFVAISPAQQSIYQPIADRWTDFA
jgi:hypothetical protein